MTPTRGATSVVDASALLALLLRESGWERCRSSLGRSPVISAVNWSEVSQKVHAGGVDTTLVLSAVSTAGLSVVPLTEDRAEATARLWSTTRDRGLSLAERACIALGMELGVPVLTADRTWVSLATEQLDVRCIR